MRYFRLKTDDKAITIVENDLSAWKVVRLADGSPSGGDWSPSVKDVETEAYWKTHFIELSYEEAFLEMV